MVKTVDDTLNIAAKTTVHVVFVRFLTGVLGAVVRFVAVHKTVTHDQINNIRRIEALAVPTTGTAFTYQER